MAKPFADLRERLLSAGVAPRHVRRYLRELADHLADLRVEEEGAGRSRAEAASAALLRLGGTEELAQAMIAQRQFQSWCVRVPWAVFGLAPLALLAGAYTVACLILWSGWKIFLPGSNSPFVDLYGFAILYFGTGKLLYFGAPILVGWSIGLVAVRQRFKSAWPAIGLVVSALIGALAHVHTSPSAFPGGAGQVGMHFGLGLSAQGVFDPLLHAAAILSFAVLPALIWKFRKVLTLSA